ncbi:MAG: GYD domain-containing protein [Anaerolineae bacterium]|nr:GYD domain-containing protein [Anaerolineae bacterium]MDW8067389.1 GYD domain-containing protein [Anaerolineae bacterium]
MTTFILLSKISLRSPGEVRALSAMDQEFDRRLKEECPEVRRIASYALLGEYDFLHIFEAPDAKTAARVALLANVFGHCTTQTLTAIPFEEFREIVEKM